MEAYLNESHYHIHIDRYNDNGLLLQGKSLETELKEDSSLERLGKKFRLSLNFDSRNAIVSYVPKDSSFEELKEVNLVIGRDAYHNLFERNSHVIRDGSRSFDLHLEESLEGFE